MSSPSPYVHACTCDVKVLIVDKDSGTVYDENCEGVVGDIDDFVVTPEGIIKEIENEQVQQT